MNDAKDDDLWLDALLRGARPAALDDDGFSTSVMARLAMPVATLRPEAALAVLRRAERRERRQVRWTIGGALFGAVVAVSATLLDGGAAQFEANVITWPLLGLFAASCGLAAVAISSRSSTLSW